MAEKELAPWRPFTELSTFRREMDRVWDSFFGERPLARIWEREWAPSLDLSETKDNFVVKAEVPGMNAKDINISLTGNLLTIKGCLLYTSPSPRDGLLSRMPSSA